MPDLDVDEGGAVAVGLGQLLNEVSGGPAEAADAVDGRGEDGEDGAVGSEGGGDRRLVKLGVGDQSPGRGAGVDGGGRRVRRGRREVVGGESGVADEGDGVVLEDLEVGGGLALLAVEVHAHLGPPEPGLVEGGLSGVDALGLGRGDHPGRGVRR